MSYRELIPLLKYQDIAVPVHGTLACKTPPRNEGRQVNIDSNTVISCHLGGHMIERIFICGLDASEDMNPLNS